MKKWIDKISRLPSYWQLKWSSFGTSRRETGPRIKLCTGSIDFFLKNFFQHIHDSQIPLNPDSSIQWWGFWMEWKKRKEKLPMIDRPESADNISNVSATNITRSSVFFYRRLWGRIWWHRTLYLILEQVPEKCDFEYPNLVSFHVMVRILDSVVHVHVQPLNLENFKLKSFVCQ